MLPVLHLNGDKIANPTVLARIPHDELRSLLEGYGYAPRFVEGSEPEAMHQLMAATLDGVLDEIAAIQEDARERGNRSRPRWPMIVLRSPKGWTGPKEVDGKPTTVDERIPHGQHGGWLMAHELTADLDRRLGVRGPVVCDQDQVTLLSLLCAGTASTGHVAMCSRCVTPPSSSPASGVRPRVPTTITSTPSWTAASTSERATPPAACPHQLEGGMDTVRG